MFEIIFGVITAVLITIFLIAMYFNFIDLANEKNKEIEFYKFLFDSDGILTIGDKFQELTTFYNKAYNLFDETSGQAKRTADVAEEMNSHLNFVVMAFKKTTDNMQVITTSSNQLVSTNTAIVQSAAQAHGASENTAHCVESAYEKMTDLYDAAENIGKSINIITEISEQNNLLALNATIEAARAGEAGIGFAVVAYEIKELAKRTSEATANILQSIERIQSCTTDIVTKITEATDVISYVKDAVASIATAVEAQTITTTEISNDVSRAFEDMQEVNEQITQSSRDASIIIQKIEQVEQNNEKMALENLQIVKEIHKFSPLISQFKNIIQAT